ncbi:hypothetical protein [Jeotgalibacillus salarius]|uniref:Uncharacterized protein n=1 Tax=Jeotgalibacillus salarius TaxID=546023 RepID=A0A4Y8LGX9_9BACL|nr:hypothetical protein [Jeotgalibacillus salarius]TFE01613.1 hypothetical protein E2626_08565 [Jeotgalibacillus salarius]
MPEIIFLSAILLLVFHTVLLFKKRFTLTERYANTVIAAIAGGAGLTLSLSGALIFKEELLWIVFGISTLSGYVCGTLSGHTSASVSGAMNGSLGSAMGVMLGEVLLNPALCGLPIQEWQFVMPVFSMIYFVITSLLVFMTYRLP